MARSDRDSFTLKPRAGSLLAGLLTVAWWLGLVSGFPAGRVLALDPGRALTQYQSRSWGLEQGLPCQDVLCVTQARDGYLWLGTEEGLVRFDGVRAQVHDRQSDSVLGGNNVASVVGDAGGAPGQLLLCSAGGLTRMVNGQVRAFCAADRFSSPPVRILLRDPADGALWVQALGGLFRVDPDGQEVNGPKEAASGWPVEAITTLCRDGAGSLWLGTARGLYRQHAGPKEEGVRFDLLAGWARKTVDHLTPTRNGDIWVGSRDAGSGRLGEDGVFRPRAALAGCVVNAMIEDRAGVLWVGTAGSGLFRLPAADAPDATPPASALTAENGLVYNQVNDLCEDREGNLWIATARGLQVLRDAPMVNYGLPEGLTGEDVRTVWEDPRGRVWIGHERGLSAREPAGDRVVNYPLPPATLRPGDHRVLCVGPGEGVDTLWVGTHAGLLRWREDRLEPLPLREDLDGAVVRALAVDLTGDRWIGTDRGVYQVRNNQVLSHLTTVGGLADDAVRALHVDGRGNLWIATPAGLTRRGADGRLANFAVAEAGQAPVGVFAIHEDRDRAGDLLVGTTLGLHRLHWVTDSELRVTRYPTGAALADDMLWSVLDDGRGSLWMSSNRGVCQVAKADLERFERGQIALVPFEAYGTSEGMRSRECNGNVQPAAWCDRAGRLWFATVRGAATIDPARPPSLPPAPLVHLEELSADGRVFPRSAGADGPEALVLPAGTQKIDLRYTALGLTRPEGNRFRYRLEGVDRDWVPAGTERVAHYTNLPPGAYRIRVQASAPVGKWDQAEATLGFRLQPFWHQTGWFHALLAGTGLASLAAGYHGLRRRWQGRLARAEAELAERTRTQEILRQAKESAEAARAKAEEASAAKGEFLSRMSHELRTPLNAILGFGQLLEMEKLAPRQLQSVEHILGGGRHLLGLVDEILDLTGVENGQTPVQPEEIFLAGLVSEVCTLVEPLAREHRVGLRVEPGVAAARVHADRRRLKQVLLNLLTNAVKYNRPAPGGGGEVVLGIQEAASLPPTGEPRARVFVRDTGIGINAAGLAKLFTPFERLGAAYGPIEGTGLGLTISKALTEAMGGTIGVESTPGVGSTFWVELPVASSRQDAAVLPALVTPTPG